MEALIQIVVEQDLDINNLQFSCESPFRNLEGVFYFKTQKRQKTNVFLETTTFSI